MSDHETPVQRRMWVSESDMSDLIGKWQARCGTFLDLFADYFLSSPFHSKHSYHRLQDVKTINPSSQFDFITNKLNSGTQELPHFHPQTRARLTLAYKIEELKPEHSPSPAIYVIRSFVVRSDGSHGSSSIGSDLRTPSEIFFIWGNTVVKSPTLDEICHITLFNSMRYIQRAACMFSKLMERREADEEAEEDQRMREEEEAAAFIGRPSGSRDESM
eukprot:gnl/Dysnectes_brevis/3367_a4238_1494.p1 GENE.gnl/Dysnectes_brevis/3367_a4238_1494~~gnl/Dysnectes_brevis/3367_a4238_1494.p1  ORF type:complete len:217 (-),score=5.01 gnl/Dysnectes_brevis/3367_a4238_1494:84-734(-)